MLAAIDRCNRYFLKPGKPSHPAGNHYMGSAKDPTQCANFSGVTQTAPSSYSFVPRVVEGIGLLFLLGKSLLLLLLVGRQADTTISCVV